MKNNEEMESLKNVIGKMKEENFEKLKNQESAHSTQL